MPRTQHPNTLSAHDAAQLAEHLRSTIGDLVRAVRRDDTLPPAHAAVLDLLDRHAAMTTAELAHRRQVRHQSMAATVKQLVESGLIAAADDGTDARKKTLRLTSEGRRVIKVDRRRRSRLMAGVIAKTLDDGEARTLERGLVVLERVTAAVRTDDPRGGSMLSGGW